MKKNLKKILVSSIVAFACSIGIFRVSQGWFDTSSNVDFNFSGSSLAAYFAGGDGSESKPFIITNPRHLYNLAWLQYLGRFNEKSKTFQQYHFELGADIDMNGFSPLPPIGTALYPFIGSFSGTNTVGIDGNAIATANQKTYKISNLKVSNKSSDFTIVPYGVTESNFKNCQIIGTFGVIGNRDAKTRALTSEDESIYSSTQVVTSKNYVKDLYLDDVKITTTADSALAGLLAGYVNGNLSDSGVHYGTIDFDSGTTKISGFDNVTKYSLIGDYNKDNVGYTGEPGAGWGGSLNVKEMYDRINYISNSGNTKWAASVNYSTSSKTGSFPNKYYALPFIVKNQINQVTYTTLGRNADEPYSVNENFNTQSSPLVKNHEETAVNNIGYLTGNSAKIYFDNFSDLFKGKLLSDFTYEGNPTTYSDSLNVTDFKIYTKTSANNDTTGISEFKTLDSKIKTTLINDFNYSGKKIYSARLTGQTDVNNMFTVPDIIVAGKQYNGTDTFSINNKTFYVCDSYLPKSSLWFVPKSDGLVKIVVTTNDKSGGGGFKLEKITRTYSSSTSVPYQKNPYCFYGGDQVTISKSEVSKVYQNKTTGKYSWTTQTDTSIWKQVYDQEWTKAITPYSLFYFEIPVEGNTEYTLNILNAPAPYLLYLDLGQNGNEATTNELKNIDFVDKDSNGALTKVTSDNLSDVVFSATMGNGQTVFYYRRKENVILYFIEGGGTLTKAGSGTASPASDYQCATAKT